MKKLLLIGLKDVRLALRDKTALAFMLLAPFLLTLGMGFVTGAIGGGSSMGLQEMPVLVVNQDAGELGRALVEVFQSPELAELVEPTLLTDPAAARRQVDDDQTTAAVIIPAGFTESIIPAAGGRCRKLWNDTAVTMVSRNRPRPCPAGSLPMRVLPTTPKSHSAIPLTHSLTGGPRTQCPSMGGAALPGLAKGSAIAMS